MTDPDRLMPLYFNTAMHRQLGYSREEFAALRVSDFEQIDTQEQIAERVASLKESGSVVFESIYSTKHGDRRNVLVSLRMISIAEAPSILAIVRDITERKRDENRIRLFMETVENATDAIGMATPEGSHFYQNKAFDDLFGDIGSDPKMVYVDPQVAHEVFDTIMAGKKWVGELQMYARDGSIRDVLIRGYANSDDHGNVISLVGIHTDITERKLAEEERLKLEQQLLHAQKLESLGVLSTAAGADHRRGHYGLRRGRGGPAVSAHGRSEALTHRSAQRGGFR